MHMQMIAAAAIAAIVSVSIGFLAGRRARFRDEVESIARRLR